MCDRFVLTLGGGKKNPLSGCLSVPSPSVGGKVVVPLQLVSGFHSRKMSKSVDDSETNCASFTKGAHEQLWPREDGTFLANKNMAPMSQMLSKASSVREVLFSFDGTVTALSCCLFFV